ncbi:MAG TPA: type II secretion system F family protein, partial [Puia sp.]
MNSSIDIRQLHKKKPAAAAGQAETAKPESSVWAFLQKDIHIMGSALPDKIKESFYLELSTLLSAGMDIRASLELIRDEQPKKKHGQIFDAMLQRVIGGATLSASLRAGKYFTPYEFFSVQIGEETGKLVVVLNELSIYYKKKNDQKRQIIGALTYPILVMTVAGLAVAFMIGYVVPMFADVLKRFGGDLPFITKLVLRTSTFIKAWGPTAG